jgi:hypothetical protein
MKSLDFFRLYLKVFKRFAIRKSLSYIIWARKNFEGPAPFSVKIKYLLAHGHPNATWVETGTYLGETTKRLSKVSARVYSIEPSNLLFAFTSWRFRGTNNVELFHGTSETQFPIVVGNLSGPVNFWLDGHFSGDITFKGEVDSPIVAELGCIESHLDRLKEVAIFIDDIRLFGMKDSGYPDLGYLVEWCNRNRLSWFIEFDIFQARRAFIS